MMRSDRGRPRTRAASTGASPPRRGAIGLPAKLAVGSAVLALLGCAAPAAMAAPALSVAAGVPVSTGPHPLGLIPTVDNATAPASSSGKVGNIILRTASLPASVDLTPDAMPVGNQGQVGSCAAWSTDYSALGYWENKQGIAGGALEPMYTYSQVDGGADNGSTIEGNLTVDESGVDTQSDYYQGNFDYKDQPTTAEKAAAVNWKLSSFTDLPVSQSGGTTTQTSIETALAAGDPVVIGIPVYDNFFDVTSADNGYYAGISGSFDGYHAIAAMGYNAQGLVIENQWGTGWGDGGYATLSWSFVNSDVFDAVEVGPLKTGQPVASAAPTITGSLQVGQTLTASTGTWSPTPTGYTYQWEAAPASNTNEWVEISGATKSTYVPVIGNQGYHLRVLVTATDATGPGASQAASTTAVLGPVPIETALPTVSGTARVGQTLTAKAGTWSNSPTSYAYQWQTSANNGATWTAIAGATAATYVTTTNDAGAKDRVVVTAANANGAGTAADSAAFGPISGTPFVTAVPAVTGTLIVGHVLSATTGTWNPAGSSYAYQWQRSTNNGSTWIAISGATSSTYTLATLDGNARVRVLVTATNGAGSAASASAETAAIVPGAPANTVKPAVTGSATRGSTLTAGTGTWTNAPTGYTYQWERSGNAGSSWTAISGATAKTYVLQSADDNSVIEVLVTATNVAGSTIASSTVTASVKPAPPVATAAPKISGSATVGAKLTATAGTWSGVGNTYAYQWQIGSGSSWSSLSGATASTLTLVSADAGQAVRVLVTATNPDGSVSDASAASATVPTPKS
jgi:hypothetical protein